MKVFAFVPAKGNSERVKNKNMGYLDGERLYIRALKKLLKCKEIDKVFLDTESEKMFEMADYLPIEFMKRNPELASNKTDGHQMFMNELKHNDSADIYVQLLCTSPFIKPETIDKAINILKNSDEYDSAILMKKDKYYFWKDGKPTYDINHIPNSVDLPETVNEAMGLYIVKKDAALKTNKRYGEKPLLIFGDLAELIDVNTPEDLKFAEIFSQGLKREENKKLGLIKHFVSSAALSDILDDMEIEKGQKCGAVLGNFMCNIKNAKLFGRASTLKLRKLKEGEDFNGIYNALDSYESMCENSVIIVENEVSENAYFGDLNARLAIRAGVSGVIIDGVTRDMNATKILNLPVFCKGYYSQDVRRRATTEYFDKPIQIKGHKVSPNDLIFADQGATVVIYQDFEEEIINKVLNSFKTENNIVGDIMKEKKVEELIDSYGSF